MHLPAGVPRGVLARRLQPRGGLRCLQLRPQLLRRWAGPGGPGWAFCAPWRQTAPRLWGSPVGAARLRHVSPVSAPADDACLSSPCQNEGTCQVTSGGFLCLCLEGYVGRLCEDSPLESSTPAPPVSSTTQALPEVSLTTNPGRQPPALLFPPPGPGALRPLISSPAPLLRSSPPSRGPGGT